MTQAEGPSVQRRICWLGLGALGLSAFGRGVAQPVDRIVRVGVLRPGSPPEDPGDLQNSSVPNAMRELGYVEGRNLVVEQRFAGGRLDRLKALAGELIDARVDVIVAIGAPAIGAARAASAQIPIVMFGNFDPIALGLVSSLARPGGNLTGILIAPDGTLAGKRLELLKEAVPAVVRVALLAPPAEPSFAVQMQETRKAAAALGIALPVVEVANGDYARAFAAVVAARADALLVGAHQYFMRDRKTIIELAARHRLPAMYEWREQVQDGGLMTYSTSLAGLYARVARQVDRILKGTKAGDIPIEQPTRFEFVMNMRTARALGLVVTPALRQRLDEIIE